MATLAAAWRQRMRNTRAGRSDHVTERNLRRTQGKQRLLEWAEKCASTAKVRPLRRASSLTFPMRHSRYCLASLRHSTVAPLAPCASRHAR